MVFDPSWPLPSPQSHSEIFPNLHQFRARPGSSPLHSRAWASGQMSPPPRGGFPVTQSPIAPSKLAITV